MIIPTILTANLDKAKEKIKLLSGEVERVQIDIIDGKFANNQTIVPEDLLGVEGSNLPFFDFHLMVQEPVAFLDYEWPGTTSQITGQIEVMPSQVEFVRRVKEEGFLAGLAVNLDTNIDELNVQALDLVDQVLLLGVKAGFSGQRINPKVLTKIKELATRRQKENWFFKIGVDGGVDEMSLVFCCKMGAEEFFIGSTIWGSKDPVAMIRKLEKIVGGVK